MKYLYITFMAILISGCQYGESLFLPATENAAQDTMQYDQWQHLLVNQKAIFRYNPKWGEPNPPFYLLHFAGVYGVDDFGNPSKWYKCSNGRLIANGNFAWYMRIQIFNPDTRSWNYLQCHPKVKFYFVNGVPIHEVEKESIK